jgi:uncharacterized membrane protein
VRTAERGFVMLSAMMILVIVAGFLGLMADTASLQYTRQKAQNAADAAAIAAYHEFRRGNTGGMIEAARGDAARNGLREGVDGTRVEVSAPPKIGEFSADSSAVEATVSQEAPTLFMRMFGPSAVFVSARAVAVAGANGGVTLGE